MVVGEEEGEEGPRSQGQVKDFWLPEKDYSILRSDLIKLYTYNSHQAQVGRWNED